nr:NAD(P)H-dependent oxidoreductase [uncultured Porphyromonas sp.]
MNVLVIYSHTYQSQSHAGKAILEVLEAQPGITVRKLEELYPDNRPIDAAAEQAALLAADVIVFQHPLFWFATPAMLKRYMDEVLRYGFAYGADSFKLAGKKFVHSYTTGSGAATYEGGLHLDVEAALRTSAGYCRMEYAGAFPLYGQLALTNPNVAAEAKAHAERLVDFLKTL